jgi:methionine synthase I (cobalamin-dependent)
VRQIHVENLLAGADIVTTNTFRTTGRTLAKAGLDPGRAPELDALAVRLVGEARVEVGRTDAFIAGSIAPLEDCYQPVFETPSEIALVEHRTQASSLVEGGCRSADGRDDADGGGGGDRAAGGGGDGTTRHSWIRLRSA